MWLALRPFVPEIVSPTNLVDIVASNPAALRRRDGPHVGAVGGPDRSLGHLDHGDGLRGRRIDHDERGRLSRGTCHGRPIVAVLAFVVVGLLIGVLNGVCTIVFDMPSFLVTLTTMMFFSGAAIWYTAAHTNSGSSIGGLPPSFLAIGYGGVGGVPYAADHHRCCSRSLMHLVLTRTVFGRWVQAVGLNPSAAAISGVPVRAVVIGCFALSGLFAAFAAIIYTARLEAGTPILGQRILLDVIGAAVIGGVSLFGGKGTVSRRPVRRAVSERGRQWPATARPLAVFRLCDQGRSHPASRR